MEEKLELTETEITLLTSTGFSEKRIRDGELGSAEEADLKAIRYTVRRMEELYPGKKIVYVEMNPGAQGGSGYSFVAYEEEMGPERTFAIFTAEGGTSEEPEFACSDTLAGLLLQPEFSAYTGRLLEGTGLNFHGFTAELPYRTEESFDRGAGAEELIAAGKCPDCRIRVELRAGGMDREAFDACVKQIGDALRAGGLHGNALVLGYDITGDDPLPSGWDSVVYRTQIQL